MVCLGSNSLETTYILFELPYLPIHRPFTTSWLSSIGRQLMILTRGTTTTFYTYLRFSTTRFIKCMVTWILTKDPLYWRNRKCSEIVIINTILLLFFHLPQSSILVFKPRSSRYLPYFLIYFPRKLFFFWIWKSDPIWIVAAIFQFLT